MNGIFDPVTCRDCAGCLMYKTPICDLFLRVSEPGWVKARQIYKQSMFGKLKGNFLKVTVELILERRTGASQAVKEGTVCSKI